MFHPLSGRHLSAGGGVERSSRVFWDLYARVYDGLRGTVAYQRLLARAVGALPDAAATLLDAGCGTGNLLEAVAESRPGLELHGIDGSAAMLRRARQRVSSARLIQGDLDAPLPWPDAHFDAVTCINVLYAVAQPTRTVSELLRVLRPGGLLIASSPTTAPSMGAVVAEHADAVGWARTLPLGVRLSALLGLNLFILRRGRRARYHFLDPDQVRRLLGAEVVERAYADQNWFARVIKPHRAAGTA
jgi:SAM-dependent methyltransferase